MPEENLYTKDCIRTYTGIYMNVFEPTLDMIRIEDIAHALSNQCRFGGHLWQFYSVAQHSTYVCHLSNPENKLSALLHDASEAYLLDIPRPIKQRLSNYKEIENNLMVLISEKFKFEWPINENVKEMDEQMLQIEWDCLMLLKNTQVESMIPSAAKSFFLSAYSLYQK